VFFSTFHVAPEEVDDFLKAWRVDGDFMGNYPPSSVASPHIFTKVGVEGICGD
jgi:hypothetical protein